MADSPYPQTSAHQGQRGGGGVGELKAASIWQEDGVRSHERPPANGPPLRPHRGWVSTFGVKVPRKRDMHHPRLTSFGRMRSARRGAGSPYGFAGLTTDRRSGN